MALAEQSRAGGAGWRTWGSAGPCRRRQQQHHRDRGALCSAAGAGAEPTARRAPPRCRHHDQSRALVRLPSWLGLRVRLAQGVVRWAWAGCIETQCHLGGSWSLAGLFAGSSGSALWVGVGQGAAGWPFLVAARALRGEAGIFATVVGAMVQQGERGLPRAMPQEPRRPRRRSHRPGAGRLQPDAPQAHMGAGCRVPEVVNTAAASCTGPLPRWRPPLWCLVVRSGLHRPLPTPKCPI